MITCWRIYYIIYYYYYIIAIIYWILIEVTDGRTHFIQWRWFTNSSWEVRWTHRSCSSQLCQRNDTKAMLPSAVLVRGYSTTMSSLRFRLSFFRIRSHSNINSQNKMHDGLVWLPASLWWGNNVRSQWSAFDCWLTDDNTLHTALARILGIPC